MGEVIETLDSQIVFSRVDLPDDGRPMMAMDAHFMVMKYIGFGVGFQGCN